MSTPGFDQLAEFWDHLLDHAFSSAVGHQQPGDTPGIDEIYVFRPNKPGECLCRFNAPRSFEAMQIPPYAVPTYRVHFLVSPHGADNVLFADDRIYLKCVKMSLIRKRSNGGYVVKEVCAAVGLG